MARPPRSAPFFRLWSAEMAYVLGYWWADGCMRIKSHGAHEIEIASNDLEHLETIAQVIGEKYFLRRVASTSNTYVISFCSKEMYQDLQKLGGTPRKSRTISCPNVPAELLPHFVRGVVDGDGTLGWNGDRPIIHIYSGSENFINNLVVMVEQVTGIPAPFARANRANLYVKWSTIRAKCLVGWLYEMNSGIALPRKAVIAHDILNWQPKKRPAKGTITDAMHRNFPAYLP